MLLFRFSWSICIFIFVKISIVGGDWLVLMCGVFKLRVIFKLKKNKNVRGDLLILSWRVRGGLFWFVFEEVRLGCRWLCM